MTVVVVTEEPSVARDIAHVVGALTRACGWLHGNGHVVTWAIGHLVGLAQPHEINSEWNAWRAESLPMLPELWPLVRRFPGSPIRSTQSFRLPSQILAKLFFRIYGEVGMLTFQNCPPART